MGAAEAQSLGRRPSQDPVHSIRKRPGRSRDLVLLKIPVPLRRCTHWGGLAAEDVVPAVVTHNGKAMSRLPPFAVCDARGRRLRVPLVAFPTTSVGTRPNHLRRFTGNHCSVTCGQGCLSSKAITVIRYIRSSSTCGLSETWGTCERSVYDALSPSSVPHTHLTVCTRDERRSYACCTSRGTK